MKFRYYILLCPLTLYAGNKPSAPKPPPLTLKLMVEVLEEIKDDTQSNTEIAQTPPYKTLACCYQHYTNGSSSKRYDESTDDTRYRIATFYTSLKKAGSTGRIWYIIRRNNASTANYEDLIHYDTIELSYTAEAETLAQSSPLLAQSFKRAASMITASKHTRIKNEIVDEQKVDVTCNQSPLIMPTKDAGIVVRVGIYKAQS